ncbi:hypothetical protein ACH0R4_RS14420, partial [Bacillus cytotoxicus]|nr:hypothetical protein [Bacillus cytotoxicus]
MSKNDEVLDISFYQLSRAAYRPDKNLEEGLAVSAPNGKTLQKWDVSKTFHDKETGMDAVVFEREVDGKTQVTVAFRGTEGDKILEKNSLGLLIKPGEGMKDLETDLDYFVTRSKG